MVCYRGLRCSQWSFFGIAHCSVVHSNVFGFAMYDWTASLELPRSKAHHICWRAAPFLPFFKVPDPSANKEAKWLNQNNIWKQIPHMLHPTNQSLISTWSNSTFQFVFVWCTEKTNLSLPLTCLCFSYRPGACLFPTICSLWYKEKRSIIWSKYNNIYVYIAHFLYFRQYSCGDSEKLVNFFTRLLLIN